MATNPYVNKVVFGNNTVMDISGDTATPSDVLAGATFHDRSGAAQVGTLSLDEFATIDLLKDTVGWTGKNLLEFSSSAVTQVIDGVTFTVSRNSSGEVTEVDANGTASANVSFSIKEGTASELSFANGKILSGCSGGSNSTYFQEIVMSDSPYTQYAKQTDDEITVSGIPSDLTALKIRIWVKSGTVLDHVKFYPMLRKASISDSTYEPYHESVKEVLRDAEVIEGKNFVFNDTPTYGGANMVATKQADGTVKIVGTDTNNFFYNIPSLTTYFRVPVSGTYRLSGCPANGSESNYKAVLQNSSAQTLATDYGSGATVTLQANTDYRYICKVNATNTAVDLTFKPMVCLATESADYEPYYIPLKDSKFNRSEQRVLGAKNLFNYTNIMNGDSNATINSNGSSIQISATGTYKLTSFKMTSLQPNTDYIFTSDIDYTSGVAYIAVSTVDSDTEIVNSGQITEDRSVTLSFNTGNRTEVRIKLVCTWSTSEAGDVTYNNPMLRLASDPDNTYAPYAMTNKELTDSKANASDLDGWTAASTVANGSVSFSGLDDTQGWSYHPVFWVDGNSTNLNPTAELSTISGTGTSSMSVTYTTDADNGASCKLRIEK